MPKTDEKILDALEQIVRILVVLAQTTSDMEQRLATLAIKKENATHG